MRSPLFEGFDYNHSIPAFEPVATRDCYWERVFPNNVPARREFPLYLRRERYDHSTDILHRHNDFYAIYFVRGGRGIRVLNDQVCSMARGDVFIMPQGATHCFRRPVDLTIDATYFQARLWSAREWELLMALPNLGHFLAANEGDQKRVGSTGHFGHLSPEPHTRVDAVLAEMRHELQGGSFAQHMAARGRFSALLVQLDEWRTQKVFQARPARGAGIAEVLIFCESNFQRAITNQQLAGQMHLSQSRFREIFTREVGMPPGVYLQHLRLEHARKLLHDKNLPIVDVARLSGFGDSSHLGRAFKKVFGITPLAFRQKSAAGAG